MRKITQEASDALMRGESYKKANTQVTKDGLMLLHHNVIANLLEGALQITNAGWFSVTTKERLNGLPGVSIHQSKGQWYLNGNVWDGSWVTV